MTVEPDVEHMDPAVAGRRPRVLVVHEHYVKTGPGTWEPKHDMSSVDEHGERVVLFRGNDVPRDPAHAVERVHEVMDAIDFCEDDFVLLTGAPELIAWTAAAAAERGDGLVRVLVWDRGARGYAPLEARIW